MSRRAVAAAAAIAVLAAVPAAGAAPGLVFGFSDDAPKWHGDDAVAPARALGARSFRLTLYWEPGEVDLDRAQRGELALGVRSARARGLRVVLAVFADSGAKAPVDARARDDYCAFVRSALARQRAIRDVVIWNEPNAAFFWRPQFDRTGRSAAPAAYQALLARCYDVLHAFRPDVNVVGLATAPRGDDERSHSPGSFVRGVGAAFRASFRTRPLFDTVGHHVYGDTFAEPPSRRHPDSKTIAQGDWNKLMWNLSLAFARTAQPLPGECAAGRCVSIWYLEAGFQTRVPLSRSGSYTGREPSTDAVLAWAGGGLAGEGARDQASQVAEAVRLAFCQPYVALLHNFLLVDEARLEGWQSGALFADWTGKPSLFALLDVVAEVNAGLVDCDALEGGRPSIDYRPPEPPTAVAARLLVAPSEVELVWEPARDGGSTVTGYRVYRDGGYIGSSTTPGFADRGATPGRRHAYAVSAQDGAGNVSDRSRPAFATLPGEGG